jgi:uncharacterized ubiquitin-like protein YukD
MKRHLGLPSGQMTTTILSRIQQFNRYIPYLPWTDNKFDADEVIEKIYNVLSTYAHAIMATYDYKRYSKNKLDARFCAYFDCLLVISVLAQGKKREPMSASKKQVTYTGKKNSFNKHHLNTNLLHKTRPNMSNASSVI